MGIFRENFRKLSGWCPDSKAFAVDKPQGTRTVPENIFMNRDTGSRLSIISAMILLLPLPSALIFSGFAIMTPIILPSTEIQMAVKALMVAIPASVLILYGRYTHDKIGSTLSGAFLFPVFGLYAQVLGYLFDPGIILVLPAQLPGWDLFAGTVPFVVLLGVMGFLASRKTNVSLLIALAMGFLAVAIVTGIR